LVKSGQRIFLFRYYL